MEGAVNASLRVAELKQAFIGDDNQGVHFINQVENGYHGDLLLGIKPEYFQIGYIYINMNAFSYISNSFPRTFNDCLLFLFNFVHPVGELEIFGTNSRITNLTLDCRQQATYLLLTNHVLDTGCHHCLQVVVGNFTCQDQEWNVIPRAFYLVEGH